MDYKRNWNHATVAAMANKEITAKEHRKIESIVEGFAFKAAFLRSGWRRGSQRKKGWNLRPSCEDKLNWLN